MKATALIRLYPARWRARYGDELSALVDAEGSSPILALDLIRGAVRAHLSSYPPAGSYPPSEEISMTRPRFQLIASLLAALAVLPAAIFLGAAIGRGMQPVEHQPARTLDSIVHAFEAFPAPTAVLLLLIGPAVALLLGLIVLITRLQADVELRSDLAVFGDVCVRLLRRPAFAIALVAVVASAAILVFLLVHSIVG